MVSTPEKISRGPPRISGDTSVPKKGLFGSLQGPAPKKMVGDLARPLRLQWASYNRNFVSLPPPTKGPFRQKMNPDIGDGGFFSGGGLLWVSRGPRGLGP